MSDPTVRDLIFSALEAALAGAAAEIEVEPIGDPSVFDALHIFDGGHVVLEREADVTRYAMNVEIAGYVEGEGGPAPTAARSALHAEVVRRLMADETLGGLAELIEDDDLRMLTATLASARRLAFSQDFTIQFATHRADPARLA